jgi:hypothetical protein
MAESTLSVTFSDLNRHVARFLGWGRTPEYSTGTISVTLGVVTLTGGTWPTTAAQGTLLVNGSFYTVNSRDSSTQITLDNLLVTSISGANYTLFILEETESRDLDDIIKSTQRMFYTPEPLDGYTHRWSFMDPMQTLATSLPYSTGTITIVAGVVTLAGGTWPTWAAQGDLRVGGVSYSVGQRDSGTQLTLDDTTATAAALTTYELVQQGFDLPDDFGGLYPGPINIRPEQSNLWCPLQRVSEETIRVHASRYQGTGRPAYFCLRPKLLPSDGSEGQRWAIRFDVPTDARYVIEFRYTVNPEAMTAADPYPWGGMAHAETFIAAALAAADRLINDRHQGEAYQHFLTRLKSSIESDRAQMAPDRLGQGTRNSRVRQKDWPPSRQDLIEADYTSTTGF